MKKVAKVLLSLLQDCAWAFAPPTEDLPVNANYQKAEEMHKASLVPHTGNVWQRKIWQIQQSVHMPYTFSVYL